MAVLLHLADRRLPRHALVGLVLSRPTDAAALANTLFLIHPPLLLFSAVVTFRSLCGFKRSRGQLAPLLSYVIAVFLGGFWAMQELN